MLILGLLLVIYAACVAPDLFRRAEYSEAWLQIFFAVIGFFIIIFSVQNREFPQIGDILLNWCRSILNYCKIGIS